MRVDVDLPAGRLRQGLCSSGGLEGPSPSLVLLLLCPTGLGHKDPGPLPGGVPGLGPRPGKVRLVFQPTQGTDAHPQILFKIWTPALP